MALTWFCAGGRTGHLKSEKLALQSRSAVQKETTTRPSQDPILEQFIYTDTTYTTATGKGITIQNSFPKGGMIAPDGTQYSDYKGKRYAFACFFTRIINETDRPLVVDLQIPADSFAIFTPPGSYLKLFLPKEKPSLDKLSEFNYGLNEIKAYLDVHFNSPSLLQKTIAPDEEHMFYVMTLSYKASGTPRAGLIWKEQGLYYEMRIAPQGSGIIPVGTMRLKK